MHNKNRPGREKKKKPGVFGLKKKQNKARRQYIIALMLGGQEWADQCVKEGKIDGSLLSKSTSLSKKTTTPTTSAEKPSKPATQG